MINTILGTKLEMKQAFTKSGQRLTVSVVKSGQNLVTQVKSNDKDGYSSVQLGFGSRKTKNITKPELGHLKGAIKEGKIAPSFLKEVFGGDGGNEGNYKAGDVINPSDVLKPGDLVSVTGVSKGKGFAGVVKRHGFAGGPKTHGQSDRLRAPGSIGQGTTPGRVYKGKRMAGRMGGERTTVKGLTVLSVSEDGTIELSGPVPGSRGSLLMIAKVGENKKYEPPFVPQSGTTEGQGEVKENGSRENNK